MRVILRFLARYPLSITYALLVLTFVLALVVGWRPM